MFPRKQSPWDEDNLTSCKVCWFLLITVLLVWLGQAL